MPTARKSRFLADVDEAARNVQPKRRRGKATPENLTDEGRVKGLSAMHSAPRCQRRRRDGATCQAPALRGATRCLKHGGRVEVPDHPHNIRRFLGGRMGAVRPTNDPDVSDQAFWEALPSPLKREVLGILPERVIANPSRLFLAARVWMDVRDRGYPAVRRFMEQFVRA